MIDLNYESMTKSLLNCPAILSNSFYLCFLHFPQLVYLLHL
jgi:hypothetical protein